MKNPVILLGTALVALSTLTGCETYALMQEGERLDKQLGENPTKSEALSRMGTPVLRTSLPDQGECLQYDRKIGNQPQPLALGFDRNGKLLGMLYGTCGDAIKAGTFKPK